MDSIGNKVSLYNRRSVRMMREQVMSGIRGTTRIFYRSLMIVIIITIWHIVAMRYNSDLMLPTPWKTALAFVGAVQDMSVLTNLALTLKRVFIGVVYALIIGVPLGFMMGYSRTFMEMMDPVIDSVRQVPIMAWVPLTIVWFGLGDGPTIFLITFSGVFPLILNTVAGVQGISKDYYHAARSMGGGPLSIFAHVIAPASIPDILTGVRVAMGLGWMSVI